jgi:DNA gyrase inhibitor GyrI
MPTIKQFPQMRIACVSEMGPSGQAVKRGFERLFAWLDANNIQPVGPSMAIFYDDPAKVTSENLRSEECVPVASDVQGSDEVRTKEIGDMPVATIIYQGEQNIQRAYNEVYDWLHAQGYRDVAAPIETYLSRLDEELRAELAVPIEKVEFPPAPKKLAEKRTNRKSVRKARGKSGPQKATSKGTAKASN